MIDKQEILAVLESPQEETRLEAVRTLVKAGGLQAAQLLKKLAGDDNSAQVRYYAQKGLDHLSRRLTREEADTPAPRGKTELMEKLSGILATGDRDVKLKALQVVALHGFKEGLETVLNHLPKEEDPFVRSKLLLTVGMLGSRSEIPILAAATEDADFRIRANAVEALEYIGHSTIYKPIIRLLQDTDHRVRGNAVKALRNYGRGPVLEVLDEMLDSTEVRMRDSALFACLTFDPQVSVPRLTRFLDDPAGPLRQKAFHALSRLAERGCEPAAAALSGKRVEQTDQDKLLDYFTLLDQAMTMEEDLPSRLGHTDFRVRLSAIHQILRDNRAEYLQLLSNRMDRETDGYVKATLVTAIGRLGGMASMGELIPFLLSEDPRLRANAIEALGDMKIESLYPKLRACLSDTSNRARGNALVALKDDPEVDAAAELDRMLQGDELMKLTACYCVTRLEREDLIDRLEPLLDDSSQKVRAKALSTLAPLSSQSAAARDIIARHSAQISNIDQVLASEFEPAEAGRMRSSLEVEKLIFDLKSGDASTRLDAIRLLADIGEIGAVEPLAPSIRAESTEERTRARQAIVAILLRQEKKNLGDSASIDASLGGQDLNLATTVHRILSDADSDDSAISMVLRLALEAERRPVIRGIRALLTKEQSLDQLRLLLILAGLLGSTDILLRYLDHPKLIIKQVAREGLEAVQGDRALAAVLPHVRSTSRTVRHNAIRALRLFPKAKLLNACRKMLRAREGKIREGGIYILTKLEFDESFSLLLDYFKVEEDLGLARKAAGTLAKFATPADRLLIETLMDGDDNTARAELARKILYAIPGSSTSDQPKAAEALADISAADLRESGVLDQEERQHFIDDLSHADPEVRKRALMELARTKDTSLLPLIRKVAFTDGDSRVAFFAKNAYDNLEMGLLPHVELKKQGEKDFSIGRFTGYLQSPDPRIRVAAIKKVVTHGEKKSIPILQKKLKEEADDWVLASILLALGELGDKRSASSLMEFVNRKDPRIRSVAIAALAELKDDSVFPILTPAILDEDPDVAAVAFSTLRKLSEDDLADYLYNMTDAKKQDTADRGLKFFLQLRGERALERQLDLLGKTADKTILIRVARNLCESGSRSILLSLVQREQSMELPTNEFTDKIKAALKKATELSDQDIEREIETLRQPAVPSVQESLGDDDEPDDAGGGMFGKLKNLLKGK